MVLSLFQIRKSINIIHGGVFNINLTGVWLAISENTIFLKFQTSGVESMRQTPKERHREHIDDIDLGK